MNHVQRQPSPFPPWRLVFLLICIFFTGGCGDLRQRAIDLWPFGPAPTPMPAPVPVSLLGWVGSEAENSALQQAIAAYEQARPNAPVAGRLLPDYNSALEFELDTAAPPDLFIAYSHELADLVDDNQILPIPTNYQVTNQITPNLADALQVDGQNYCFPRDVALLALFYNPAVFDRAAAGYPLNTWDWAALRAAIDSTADINNGFYGLTLDYDLSRFLPFLIQSGRDDDLWQGDDALAALEYFMDLYNDEVAAVPSRLDSTWNGEAFGRGRAAMTIEGNWLVNYLNTSFPGFTYGIVELPSGPSGRGTTAFISCWVVNADSENAAGAFGLAAFLTAPAQTLAWSNASGNLPPTLEQATTWVANQPTYAPFVAALPYATAWTGRAGFIEQAQTVNLSMDMWYQDNMTTPELVGVLAGMSDNPPLPTPTPTASPDMAE